MSIVWKYKIELVDEKCFEKYEKEYGIVIPSELKDFIKDNNAASPNMDCIMFNGQERVVDSILSFNSTEDEATTFLEVYNLMEKKSNIPFAADPFGNYFYYSAESQKIGFYEHEEEAYSISEYSFSDFIDSLYES